MSKNLLGFDNNALTLTGIETVNANDVNTTNVNANVIVFKNTLNGISTAVFSYLSNLTGNIQVQFNNITSNYLTTVIALNTYQTISGMATYISRITALETKSTALSYSGTTSTFTGTINGAIDNNSTINSISTSNFDYNGSINASLNGTTGSLPVAIKSINQKTTGQVYQSDIGYGDTTTFQATNLCCDLLYTNNTNPQVGVDIGTQIGNINTLIYNLQSKLFDLVHSGTTTTISNSLVFTGTLNTITPTIFGYLSGLTSNIQIQFTNALSRITTLETKSSALSYSGSTSTFSGTIHGAIDNTSTINSISTSNFDYNGSINASINSATGSLPISIRAINQKTTGQVYQSDIGYGDTTTFLSSNLCCGLLYTNNAGPSAGVDIGTQITSINNSMNNLTTNLNTTNTNVSAIQNMTNYFFSNYDSTVLNTGLIPYLTTLTTVSTNAFSQTFSLANTGYYFQVGQYIISCSGFNGSFE